MDGFVEWLAATKASAVIQNFAWIIPAVQCIHILAISVVMSSTLLLNLRLVGIVGGGESKDVFTRRYLPWVWSALVVLLLSGSILIVGEPHRDLINPTFWIKMSLVLLAIFLTAVLELPVLQNAHFWESKIRRVLVRPLAAGAICCWIAIALCGRWIAYTYTS
jgi:hypothetical protein